MEKIDRQIDVVTTLNIIDNAKFGTMSMIDLDGQAYGIPLSLSRQDDSMYFHCGLIGKKIEILKNNAKVCISFVGSIKEYEDKFTIGFESAIVYGTVHEVIKTEEKIEGLRLISNKFTPKNMDKFDISAQKSLSKTRIWRIDIERMYGKIKI